jgi:hypothetical protein
VRKTAVLVSLVFLFATNGCGSSSGGTCPTGSAGSQGSAGASTAGDGGVAGTAGAGTAGVGDGAAGSGAAGAVGDGGTAGAGSAGADGGTADAGNAGADGGTADAGSAGADGGTADAGSAGADGGTAGAGSAGADGGTAGAGASVADPGSSLYQGDRVHVMGDSLTYYGWHVPLESLVAAATDETGATMHVTWTANGQPGYHTDSITASLSTMLFPYAPDVVVIESGRNDNAVAAVEYMSMTGLIDAIRAWKPNIRIIVVSVVWAGEIWTQTGVLPPAWDNTAHGGYSDTLISSENNGARLAAASRGVTWCDARAYVLDFEVSYNPGKLAFGAPGVTLTDDGTHPNAHGQQIMSQAVLGCLSFGSAALKPN